MPYTLKRLLILATAILFLLPAFTIIRLAQQGWIRRSENLALTQGRSKRLVQLPVQVNRLIPNGVKSEFGEEQTMGTKNSRLQFRQTVGCILAAILVFVCSSLCWAANDRDIPHIDATVKFDHPPEWAVLQRQLIDQMNTSADVFIEKYLEDDGSFRYNCWGKLDDSYETFHNWPTFYTLGGDVRLLSLAKRQWEAITRHFTDNETLDNEFHRCDDWFHLGEGSHLFYMLCLADPFDPKFIERAQRFAGFYLNENPGAKNYDPDHKLILNTRTGSNGPPLWTPEQPWEYVWTMEHYGLPFYDVPGIASYADLNTDDNMKKMAATAHVRWGRGDGPINLAVTSLMLNAFLATGEDKYRAWIMEYTDAWINRVRDNRGILPDNVGLSGKIGEYTDNEWYGGYYGWTVYHGWGGYAQSTGMASENALLVTGDSSYLDLLRSQIDLLLELGIVKNNTVYVPHKHGPQGKVVNTPMSFLPVLRNLDGTCKEVDGWFKFMPMDPVGPAHLWNMSMDPADLERSKKIRNHDPEARWSRDWERVESISRFMSKDHGGHEAAWQAYLDGTYPTYPEEILKYNIGQVNGRLDEIHQHQPEEHDGFSLIYRNPISVEGLVNLTMGAPLPFYNGGLMMARVRHFDPENRRPGLPPDVAALVSELGSDRTVLHLVNLSQTHSRAVVIQAGTYAEHQFITATYLPQSGGETSLPVNAARLTVHLPSQSQIKLDITTKRFAHRPSYAFPW